jgi:hypothetical protein
MKVHIPTSHEDKPAFRLWETIRQAFTKRLLRVAQQKVVGKSHERYIHSLPTKAVMAQLDHYRAMKNCRRLLHRNRQ